MWTTVAGQLYSCLWSWSLVWQAGRFEVPRGKMLHLPGVRCGLTCAFRASDCGEWPLDGALVCSAAERMRVCVGGGGEEDARISLLCFFHREISPSMLTAIVNIPSSYHRPWCIDLARFETKLMLIYIDLFRVSYFPYRTGFLPKGLCMYGCSYLQVVGL